MEIPELMSLPVMPDTPCRDTVTLDSPSPDQNKFGQALVHFQGAPDFSPTRIAEPGPTGFPLAKFQPGAVAGPGYSPLFGKVTVPVVPRLASLSILAEPP